MHVRKRPDSVSRLCIVIRRTVGTAIFRNRTKRRIREVFRRSKDRITPAADIVIRVKKEVRDATFWDLAEDFFDLLEKYQLIPSRQEASETLKKKLTPAENRD